MFFRSTFLATSLLVGMRPLENWLIFNNLDFYLASPILHHTLWHNNFIQLGSYTFFKSLTILTCTQHFNNFGILAFENILLFASGFINRWSLKGSLGMDESVTDLHIIFFLDERLIMSTGYGIDQPINTSCVLPSVSSRCLCTVPFWPDQQ